MPQINLKYRQKAAYISMHGKFSCDPENFLPILRTNLFSHHLRSKCNFILKFDF